MLFEVKISDETQRDISTLSFEKDGKLAWPIKLAYPGESVVRVRL